MAWNAKAISYGVLKVEYGNVNVYRDQTTTKLFKTTKLCTQYRLAMRCTQQALMARNVNS